VDVILGQLAGFGLQPANALGDRFGLLDFEFGGSRGPKVVIGHHA
jgi:hypothetical protein